MDGYGVRALGDRPAVLILCDNDLRLVSISMQIRNLANDTTKIPRFKLGGKRAHLLSKLLISSSCEGLDLLAFCCVIIMWELRGMEDRLTQVVEM